MDKCPYCFRNEGTWIHDPLLVVTGAPQNWIPDTEIENTELENISEIEDRFYRGFQFVCYIHFKELQDDRRILEEAYLIEEDRTTFSPIGEINFLITGQHIKELRESTEKLLDAFGIDKITYFNYDEDGNHIIRPEGDKEEWDNNVINDEDWNKFQINNLHIEELRHFIEAIAWKETWDAAPIGEITNISGYGTITHMFYVDGGGTLEADHHWNDSEHIQALTGSVADGYTVTEILGEEDDKYFSFRNHMYLNGYNILFRSGAVILLNGNIGVNTIVGYRTETFFPYSVVPVYPKCHPNLRFEVEDFVYSMITNRGTNVIIRPDYPLSIDDTNGELNRQKETQYHTYIGFEISAGGMTIQYLIDEGVYPMTGDDHKIAWVPDENNGRYLYDDFLVYYPTLTEEDFSALEVSAVRIIVKSIASTIALLYLETPYGYTKNVSVDINFSVNKIQLRRLPRG